jgi:hypothetical protein
MLYDVDVPLCNLGWNKVHAYVRESIYLVWVRYSWDAQCCAPNILDERGLGMGF